MFDGFLSESERAHIDRQVENSFTFPGFLAHVAYTGMRPDLLPQYINTGTSIISKYANCDGYKVISYLQLLTIDPNAAPSSDTTIQVENTSSEEKNKALIIALSVLFSVLLIAVIIVLVLFVIRQRILNQRKNISDTLSMESVTKIQVQRFTSRDIKVKDLIGKGNFGEGFQVEISKNSVFRSLGDYGSGVKEIERQRELRIQRRTFHPPQTHPPQYRYQFKIWISQI
jgi:hypothetical protein